MGATCSGSLNFGSKELRREGENFAGGCILDGRCKREEVRCYHPDSRWICLFHALPAWIRPRVDAVLSEELL